MDIIQSFVAQNDTKTDEQRQYYIVMILLLNYYNTAVNYIVLL